MVHVTSFLGKYMRKDGRWSIVLPNWAMDFASKAAHHQKKTRILSEVNIRGETVTTYTIMN